MSLNQDRDKIEDNNEEMDVEIDDMDIDPPSASEIIDPKSDKILTPSKSKASLRLSSLPTTGEPHTSIPPPKEVLSVHNTVVEALTQGLAYHSEAEVEIEMGKLKEEASMNSDTPNILTNLLLKKRPFPSSTPQSIYPKESNIVENNHKEFPTLTTIIDPSEVSQKTGVHVDWSNIDVVAEKKSRKSTQVKPSRASKPQKSSDSSDGEFVEQKKRKKPSVSSTTSRRKKIKKIEESESDEEKSGDSEIDITSKPEEEHIDQNVAILLTSLAGNSQPPTPRQEKKKRRPKKEPVIVEEKYTPRSSRSSRSLSSKRFTDPTDFDFYEGWTGEVALVKTPHWPWWPALVIKKDFVKSYRNWGQRPQGAKSTFTIPVFNLFDIHGIGQSWVTDPEKIRLFEAFNIPEYTEKPLFENEKLRTSQDTAEKFKRAIEAARLHLSQSKDLMVEYLPELPDELSALVPTAEELQGPTEEVNLELTEPKATPSEEVQPIEPTTNPNPTEDTT